MTTPRPIFEKKNVLVTGGAGFIGSHLCDELVKSSKVICVDNFITGREENINHLLANPDFKFLRHDMTQPLDLTTLAELRPFKVVFQGIQEIYHLACPTSPKEYNRYPIETLLANAYGTKNVLDLGLRYQAKVVFASTSAVYGEPTSDDPFPESYWGFVDPVGPRSCYNEGKRFAESLCANFAMKEKLEVKIARIFNTFGPRMKLTDGRAIPDFINQALKNKPLVVYGGEGDTSTFCYVSDIVDSLVKLMASNEQGPLNLGSPKLVRYADIAKQVLKACESTSKIVFESRLPYTAKQGVPDITLAKDRLGWFPVVPLEEGLRRTIEQMRASRIVGIEEVG